MKLIKTYSLKAPEGSPDSLINTENQNKYVAFYGGVFTLDMYAKEKDFTNNPFLGGGLVGKAPSELGSILGREELIEITNVCSIEMLLKQLRSYNKEEFDRVAKKLLSLPKEPQPELDMLLLKPENF